MSGHQSQDSSISQNFGHLTLKDALEELDKEVRDHLPFCKRVLLKDNFNHTKVQLRYAFDPNDSDYRSSLSDRKGKMTKVIAEMIRLQKETKIVDFNVQKSPLERIFKGLL